MKTRKKPIAAQTFESKFEGYDALKHPDGTYTLQNIPIFGEVSADENGNKVAVTPEWLRAAVDRSLKLHDEGFAGPTHEEHHEKWDALGQPRDKRPRVGALVVKDLRPYKVEGKVEQTIFADVAGISAEVFEKEILTGKLPHASVEYIEQHRPAIDSLTLTGSGCPFKRYPNIKVRRVIEAPVAAQFTVYDPPAPSAKAVTYLTGGNVADEPKKDAPPAKDAKKDAPPVPSAGGTQDAQTNPGHEQDGTNPNADQKDINDASVGVAPPWAVSMTQAFSGLVAVVQAIATKIGAPFSAAQPSGPATLPNGINTPILNTVQDPVAPAMDAKTFGDLHGQVQTLLRKDAARDKEAATTLSVATFEAKCKGWQFEADDRKALRVCIEAGGELAAQAFVDQVKKRPKEMTTKASDFRANSEPIQDSPAVMTYVAKGPTALEHARRFSAMHAQLVAAGMNPSSEDKFIEHQFATAADLHRANVILKGEK